MKALLKTIYHTIMCHEEIMVKDNYVVALDGVAVFDISSQPSHIGDRVAIWKDTAIKDSEVTLKVQDYLYNKIDKTSNYVSIVQKARSLNLTMPDNLYLSTSLDDAVQMTIQYWNQEIMRPQAA